MRHLFIISILVLSFTQLTYSQNELAKIEFSQAESNYEAGNFNESLANLETVKGLLGSTNAKVMYLESMALFMSYAKKFMASASVVQSTTRELRNYTSEEIQLLYKIYLKSAGYEVDETVNINQHPKFSEAMTNVIGNLTTFSNMALFEERLQMAIKLQAISEEYITTFQEQVPIDKLKDIYDIQKAISKVATGAPALERGLKALDAKDYNKALTSFQNACDEGNTTGCTGVSLVTLEQSRKDVSSSLVDNYIDTMVFVEGGTFSMGGKVPKLDKELQPLPEHDVSLNSFYIGKYEVDLALYNTVMGITMTRNEALIAKKSPASRVSRDNALEFISKLNTITGLKYRLPTEAEWEFAARGGNNSQDYKFSGSNNAKDVAKHDSEDKAIIGFFEPNELGIHDMTGNLYEWCSDYFSNTYYQESPKENPQGPSTGTSYVIRGGSYNSDKHALYNWFRNSIKKELTLNNVGFRLAMDAN